jgi:hypothetical protein
MEPDLFEHDRDGVDDALVSIGPADYLVLHDSALARIQEMLLGKTIVMAYAPEMSPTMNLCFESNLSQLSGAKGRAGRAPI